MGRELWWSPTQVGNFDDCETKWWYASVEKRPRPSSPGADFGNKAHAHRETWFKTGVMPNGENHVEACARAGLEDLPLPGKAQVEIPFKWSANNGGAIARRLLGGLGVAVGKIDLFHPRQSEMQDPRYPGDYPLVLDHKFLARDMYVKNEEYLKRFDPQFGIYGAYGLDSTSCGSVTMFWHHVIKDKPPRPIPVRFTASKDEVLENFEGRVLPTVRKMLAIHNQRDTLRVADLRRNPASCSKYGGCPFRSFCPITNEEKMGVFKMSEGDFATQFSQFAAQNGTNQQQQLPAMMQDNNQPQAQQPPPQQQQAQQGGFGQGMQGFGQQAQQPPQQQQQQQAQQPPPQQAQQPPPQQQQQQAQQPPPQQQALGFGQQPAQQQQPTLAQLGQQQQQAVVPPDAQPATMQPPAPPEKKTRKRKDTTLSRRDQFTLEVFKALIAKGYDLGNMTTYATATGAADQLLAQLDATK